MQHRQISEMNHAQSTSSINQPLVSLKNLPNRYQRRKMWIYGRKEGEMEYLTLEETSSGRYNHWVSITGRLWRSVCFEELRIRPIRGDDLWVMTSSFLITPFAGWFHSILDRNVETWREEMEKSRREQTFRLEKRFKLKIWILRCNNVIERSSRDSRFLERKDRVLNEVFVLRYCRPPSQNRMNARRLR